MRTVLRTEFWVKGWLHRGRILDGFPGNNKQNWTKDQRNLLCLMKLLQSMKPNIKRNDFNCQFQFISTYFTPGFNFHLKDDLSEPGKGIYFHLCRNQNIEKKRDAFGRERSYVTLNRGKGGYNIKGKIFQNCKKNIFHQEMFPMPSFLFGIA